MGDDERPGPDAELRLAVAFTGGLSLAVWMGGVARELNLLTTAARAEEADTHAGRVRARYKKLLELLRLPETVEDLLKACRISEETFTKEKDSRLLSHTVAHSAVVTANAVRAAVDRWYWRLLFGTVSGTLRLAHAFRRRPRRARTPH